MRCTRPMIAAAGVAATALAVAGCSSARDTAGPGNAPSASQITVGQSNPGTDQDRLLCRPA